LDASRAVVVVNQLMDKKNSHEYVADIKAEYEELRKEYLLSQKDKSFVSLAKARQRKLRVDWNKISITKPSYLGT
jgi:5-methyltetrahydrofolate--homocysteine methyltransferase